jgi:heme/copper-type cytochrome/quinol oxidase subunit 3
LVSEKYYFTDTFLFWRIFMIKKALVFCVLFAAFVFAQSGGGSTDEMIYRESKRLKASAITSLSLGTAIMASGITLTAVNYSDFKEGGSRAGEENAKSKERGGYVAGGLITAMGLGVNLTAIPIFKRRNRMIETARNETSYSLIVKPDRITFMAAF